MSRASKRRFAEKAVAASLVLTVPLATVGCHAACGSCDLTCESVLDIGLTGSSAAFPPGTYKVEVGVGGRLLTCTVKLADPSAGFVGGDGCRSFFPTLRIVCPNGECDASSVRFGETIELDPFAFGGTPPAEVVLRQSINGKLKFAKRFTPSYTTFDACGTTCTSADVGASLD
jgi:hypothetical protein